MDPEGGDLGAHALHSFTLTGTAFFQGGCGDLLIFYTSYTSGPTALLWDDTPANVFAGAPDTPVIRSADVIDSYRTTAYVRAFIGCANPPCDPDWTGTAVYRIDSAITPLFALPDAELDGTPGLQVTGPLLTGATGIAIGLAGYDYTPALVKESGDTFEVVAILGDEVPGMADATYLRFSPTGSDMFWAYVAPDGNATFVAQFDMPEHDPYCILREDGASGVTPLFCSGDPVPGGNPDPESDDAWVFTDEQWPRDLRSNPSGRAVFSWAIHGFSLTDAIFAEEAPGEFVRVAYRGMEVDVDGQPHLLGGVNGNKGVFGFAGEPVGGAPLESSGVVFNDQNELVLVSSFDMYDQAFVFKVSLGDVGGGGGGGDDDGDGENDGNSGGSGKERPRNKDTSAKDDGCAAAPGSVALLLALACVRCFARRRQGQPS